MPPPARPASSRPPSRSTTSASRRRINFRSPNPQIDFEASPFFVNTELLDWPRTDEPRRAGVSSFGFGGTNAHIVLEEAPEPAPLDHAQGAAPWILTLSAKTADALDRRRQLLADHLAAHPETDLADAAHTLAVGRSRMPHRSAVIADDSVRRDGHCSEIPAAATAARTSAVTGAEVAFLFTGQGAQYVGMGAGLYGAEPVFAAALDECAAIVGEIDGHDLIDLLFGGSGRPGGCRANPPHGGRPARYLRVAVRARHALWASWGIRPTALVGHSVGEFAAACIGGVFSLEDALALARRPRSAHGRSCPAER